MRLAFAFCAIAMVTNIATWAQTQAGPVEARGKEIYVGGKPFLVKGVYYGPWRPGTGPAKGYPYPGPAEIESDLQLIRDLHANTILVTDPPGYVLDLAEKYGIKVFYSFYIDWWSVGSADAAPARQNLYQQVKQYRDKAALLGWLLGNEIPLDALEKRGQKVIEDGLAEIYHSVKTLDKRHPIAHSNWPVAKDLDLHFFDVIGFNLYPVWPPEVVAIGFDRYIQEVLQPIAGNKPLLISEFGANSLEAKEADQARLVLQCWNGLLKSGACGGIVFEFADEWWKNYDNPRRAGNWWDRKAAPEDEKSHDQDPEEYYGVFKADRQPKSASSVVRQMFTSAREQSTQPNRVISGSSVLLLILIALGSWIWAKRRVRVQLQVRDR